MAGSMILAGGSRPRGARQARQARSQQKPPVWIAAGACLLRPLTRAELAKRAGVNGLEIVNAKLL